MSRPVIAILASGEGTTAEAFIRASAEGKIEPVVGLVIASKPRAGIIERTKKLNEELGLNIEVVCIGKKTHPVAADEEAALLEVLQAGQFDAMVLMGYMKKIGPRLVREYGWLTEYTSPYQARFLNTHAGLLPETKGLFGIHKEEHVIAEGLPESGYTLHLVAEDYDEGPIVAEHRHKVAPGETAEQLHDRDQALEKEYLPLDVAKFIAGRQKYLKKGSSND